MKNKNNLIFVKRAKFNGSFSLAWEQRKAKNILKSQPIDIDLEPNEFAKYEVIQQGNEPIAGYTNKEPFQKFEPIVLFGDHTLSIYKPKSPFLVASDGVKGYFLDNVKGNYFYHLLSVNLPKNEGYKRYSSILKNRDFMLTYNIIEEEKISTLLDNLDNLITLHQRECKFCKEKIFIKIKKKTNTWEQRELSELGKIETGNTPSTAKSEYYTEDGLPWITPTDIISNITINTERTLSIEGAKVARVIPANSILCTCIASIGKNTFSPVKCAFNQQINALTPDNNQDPYFMFTDSYHWSQTMKRGAGGLTFQIVNKTEFSNIQTNIPKKDEQGKIGNLFHNLDSLIALHQRE